MSLSLLRLAAEKAEQERLAAEKAEQEGLKRRQLRKLSEQLPKTKADIAAKKPLLDKQLAKTNADIAALISKKGKLSKGRIRRMNELEKQRKRIKKKILDLDISSPRIDIGMKTKELQEAKNNKNWDRVLELTQLLAEEGQAQEQADLAWMYLQGQGLEPDRKEAIKWYKLSENQGNADAREMLGSWYCEGEVVVAKDHKEKIKWCQIAAKLGNPDAQYKLGDMYVEGEGVPKDHEEAVKWFRLAADHDNMISFYAQYSLGDMYSKGKGVQENNAHAHMWFSLCGSMGEGVFMRAGDCQNLRDSLEEKMTPEEITVSQGLAADWKQRMKTKWGYNP